MIGNISLIYHLYTVVVRAIIAVVKHHDEKQVGKKRDYFAYISKSQTVHHLRKPWQDLKLGRNLEVKADLEDMEDACLLVCSSWLAKPASLKALNYQIGVSPLTICLVLKICLLTA